MMLLSIRVNPEILGGRGSACRKHTNRCCHCHLKWGTGRVSEGSQSPRCRECRAGWIEIGGAERALIIIEGYCTNLGIERHARTGPGGSIGPRKRKRAGDPGLRFAA
jgi:hypothetical protein